MNDKVVCPCGVRIRHSDATTVAGALVLNEDDVVERMPRAGYRFRGIAPLPVAKRRPNYGSTAASTTSGNAPPRPALAAE